MFVSECLSANENGHLMIGGCDTVELAKQFGTPLYVMDESDIIKNCKLYQESLNRYYDGNGLVLYASKAFSCMYMCKLMNDLGMGLDVVSGGELYTAWKAGFDMSRVYFHGNNKTDDELKLAVEHKVGTIVVDNVDELERLNRIASEKDVVVRIMFRIKPGIDAHTHSFIQTGQIDSKFGVALENGEAIEAYRRAVEYSHLKVMGVHCHIGSQIFDLEPFKLAAKVMMNFIGDLHDKLNIEIEELNLGGGYGIKYTEEDQPINYDAYIQAVSEVVKQMAQERGVNLPKIMMEPGRSIVAPAGITLYTVGGVKEIKDVRTYVSVDGGMIDNPRYILYESKYDAVLANKATAPRENVVTIAGKCCESGDLLIKDIKMPHIEVGDTLAVLATGAYNYSMASHYNRIPNPPVIMVKDGQAKEIVRRESYEDLLRNDIL
ncbi:MAG: diaminopimelate decarboxylase [Clostridia bacterium]|nr:diaminopimelate decarboxylase [Clostridia bacterium]